MTQTTLKKVVTFMTPTILLFVAPVSAYAATISLSPASGTVVVNQPFTVAVNLNENSDKFNAAQAAITLSPNLTPTDLVLGNCGFSFIKTPSTQDLSFVGVNLGGWNKNCTVYTVTLTPNGSGTGSLNITNGSVKRYGDAFELLTAIQYGSYTIGSSSIGNLITNAFGSTATNQFVPAVADASTIKTASDLANYNLNVKVLDSNNNPVQGALVTLKPQLQAKDATNQQAKTNADGIAVFDKVDPSIYTIQASNNNKLLAQNIINAKGNQQVLTLGLQEQKTQPNYFLFAGILGLLAAAFVFRLRIRKLFQRE